MNFELGKEQREIKERAAEFADREVAPYAAELDREDRFPNEAFEKLADAGFMGLCVPEEYGGAGTDFLSYVLLLEEISRADAGVGVTLAVHTSAGTLPIVMYGDEEQKSRWVPDLARGEKIGCFALTEPEAGSDAAAIQTSAERVDGGGLPQLRGNGLEGLIPSKNEVPGLAGKNEHNGRELSSNALWEYSTKAQEDYRQKGKNGNALQHIEEGQQHLFRLTGLRSSPAIEQGHE